MYETMPSRQDGNSFTLIFERFNLVLPQDETERMLARKPAVVDVTVKIRRKAETKEQRATSIGLLRIGYYSTFVNGSRHTCT